MHGAQRGCSERAAAALGRHGTNAPAPARGARETGAGMRVIRVHGSSLLALCGGILWGLSSAE